MLDCKSKEGFFTKISGGIKVFIWKKLRGESMFMYSDLWAFRLLSFWNEPNTYKMQCAVHAWSEKGALKSACFKTCYTVWLKYTKQNKTLFFSHLSCKFPMELQTGAVPFFSSHIDPVITLPPADITLGTINVFAFHLLPPYPSYPCENLTAHCAKSEHKKLEKCSRAATE